MFIVPEGEPTELQKRFMASSRKIDEYCRDWMEAERKRSRRIQKRRQALACVAEPSPPPVEEG